MSDTANTTLSSMRASDAERDQVATLLKDQTAIGRLTLAEFDERIGATYSARTREQLRSLIADLPTDREAEARPASGDSANPLFCVLLFACPPVALVYWLSQRRATRTSLEVAIDR